jgi:Fe-S-cluster containining protein
MEIGAIEIEKETLCPCGSKKQYKNCCATEGRRYALLEYEGKRILFDVDKTEQCIERLVRFCSDDILKLTRDKGAMIDKEKALRDLKNIYEMTDKALEPFLHNSSCEKGCNACCYLIVDSTAIEAEMVRRYMEEHLDDDERRRVLKKIKEAKHHYPDPVGRDEEFSDALVEKHFALNIPCPFLSSVGLCTIYEVRPINCRKHIVFSDPSQCKIMATTASYEAEYFLQVYPALNCLSVLVYPELNFNRHFPDWFTEEFDLFRC